MEQDHASAATSKARSHRRIYTVQLANGFFGTFFSLRVAIENFSAPGVVLSA